MKKRYITFYKFHLTPIPHFKSYGILLTERWLTCMLIGFKKMVSGEVSFFTFVTPTKKHFLPFH